LKTCSKIGCTNLVFSHLYCRIHQWCRTDDTYKAYKERKKQGKIPSKSKKRKVEEKYYAVLCKELEQEIRAKNNGKIYCFFSGLEINERISWHHTNKRTGNFYLDKEWIVPSINKYHMMFHFTPVQKLMQESWYEGFLNRLKLLSEELYNKEANKQIKALRLNPEIEFDNDL
jgi:hypothetical protein